MFRTSLHKKGEKERVRVALLRAALRLGAVHGFASLGLREVAREAGIAPTSFYRHFADMQELGLVLSRELVGEAISHVCEALSTGSGPVEALAWDAMLEACTSDPELMRFFVAERVGASAALRASLQAQLDHLAMALQSASGPEPSQADKQQLVAADAAAIVLLDACVRALDPPNEAADARLAQRELCIVAVARLLAAPSGGRAASSPQARPSGAKSGR